MVSILAFLLTAAYREAEAQAETLARNTVEILEAQVNSTLRRIQADLEVIAATTPRQALRPDQVRRHSEAINGGLLRHARYFPEIVGYRVMDADGNLLYTSQPELPRSNAQGRSYFEALKNDPKRGLVFSEVLIGRITPRPLVFAAVPIRGGEGEFLGMVVAALDLDHFQRLFNAVDLGDKGVITFRRSDDGRLVLRRPEQPGTVNRPLQNNPMHLRIEAGERQGIIRYVAHIDQIERIYAYRRVGDYPFYVAAGIASVDFLASWRSMALTAAFAVAAVLLVFAGVIWRLNRLAAEERRLAGKLRESETVYRSLLEGAPFPIVISGIADGAIKYLNRRAQVWLEAAPEELLGQADRDLYGNPECRDRLQAPLEEGGEVEDCEVEMRPRSGRQRWATVSMRWVEFGGEPAIFSAFSDISGCKADELAMADANEKLVAQLDEIGRLQTALEEQAIRDALTGLYNRRYLDETLDREVARARRDGSPLSLIMIDIDHFKKVNDIYGHQAGDLVLKALGRLLADKVRTEDVPCRYGGEEFLILLPGMPLETARTRAEEWRREVGEISVAFGSFILRITASFGVAAYPDHAKTPDQLTQCADRALYAAKHAGRNRVEVLPA